MRLLLLLQYGAIAFRGKKNIRVKHNFYYMWNYLLVQVTFILGYYVCNALLPQLKSERYGSLLWRFVYARKHNLPVNHKFELENISKVVFFFFLGLWLYIEVAYANKRSILLFRSNESALCLQGKTLLMHPGFN